jgi:hypothetical protein
LSKNLFLYKEFLIDYSQVFPYKGIRDLLMTNRSGGKFPDITDASFLNCFENLWGGNFPVGIVVSLRFFP